MAIDPKSATLDPHTFGSVLGQVVWLMSMSKEHRDLPIHVIDQHVLPAILLKSFKLYSKGKQPVAFLAWAAVSDEVKERIESGSHPIRIDEWRSGENIIVLDCVAPLADRAELEAKFLTEAIAHSNVDAVSTEMR